MTMRSGELSRVLVPSCLMNGALLRISPTSRYQLVKMLINIEAHIYIYSEKTIKEY